MRSIPAWSWSVAALVIIFLNLSLGGGGPEGRALSRALYPIVVSVVLALTLFSYMQQHARPTHLLRLINIAAVVVAAYVAFPIWHFGVVLPTSPGDAPYVRWWVNGVVLVLAVLCYFVLSRFTRSLRAGGDKPEHLTV